MTSPRGRLGLLLVLLVAGLAVGVLGPGDDLLSSTASRQAAGPWMPPVLTLVFALLVVVFVPRPALAAAVGAVFGVPTALAVATVGTALGAGLSFALARALGREALAPWLSKGKLQRLDSQFARHGFLATVLCRFVPVLPFAAVNYGAAFTRVRAVPFLVGTTLGTLPANILYVAFGGALAGGLLSAVTDALTTLGG